MVLRALATRDSGPLNPAPVMVACRGQSTVLGFTWGTWTAVCNQDVSCTCDLLVLHAPCSSCTAWLATCSSTEGIYACTYIHVSLTQARDFHYFCIYFISTAVQAVTINAYPYWQLLFTRGIS